MMDQDSEFNGETARVSPLGGTESAFVSLAEAFAKLGHNVVAMTKITKDLVYEGVHWKSINSSINKCDLSIVNRAPELLDRIPTASKSILWLHNPANYLSKLRNFRRLFFKRITVICSGKYHFDTLPSWIKSRAVILPLGITDELFLCETTPEKAPDPEVIFTSNPERGLAWLVDIWHNKIITAVPNAKLNVYAGSKTYGGRHEDLMTNILNDITNLKEESIKVFEPIEKKYLFKKISESRAMLYLGDKGETFCLAVAEAQALGLPCIVKPIGCLAERVKHNLTGEVIMDDTSFVNSAINILTNDKDWSFYRDNCIKLQRDFKWENIAKKYLNLIN